VCHISIVPPPHTSLELEPSPPNPPHCPIPREWPR
jgi:hypothetical protein